MFRSPLYRHGNFLRLWIAQTVSLFGTQVTTLALPTVAILLLHASPFEVGVLAAMPWLAYASIGLIAGVIADHMPRRRIMVIADLGRALVLGSIPLAFLLGVRSIVHLYLVAALVGASTSSSKYRTRLTCLPCSSEAASLRAMQSWFLAKPPH